ncbi:MAG: SGNH/GDSL hydrolase family protein [Bradyrhizobium sp.]|uniref:SGNH/GDSL hydrolase family protein n=1 Tax=Bradyrhizobium sp. TaxID=376 RepID=UPI003D0C93F0
MRETLTERSLAYDYDPELGWMPQPGSASTIETFRTTHYRHNSLGLRDEEFKLDAKPTIMFLGDSFVWGLDSEAEERFSDLLKPRNPDYKILAAGVSGYGTDQEYLLLQKLWPKVKPAVVVLIFCGDNDRLDNVTSHRYDHYQKPYFATQPDGTLVLRGQPVPRSQANRIPFVKLEGADSIKEKKGWGPHWTPAGQKDVADRIFAMLAENGVVAAAKKDER